MLSIDFGPTPGSVQHKCTSDREGDWIVFRCPKCPDYERRLNWRTGEMKVRAGKGNIQHTGFYLPDEYVEFFRTRDCTTRN